ncbi:sulfur carrier protein ThiS [Luteimonas sp. A501]
MNIILNGEAQTLPGPCTVLALLESNELAGRKVAVEVNGTIIPRSLHAEHALKAGDRIEVVHALGGG